MTAQSKKNKYTHVGDIVSIRVCVDGSGNITLVPNTKAEI